MAIHRSLWLKEALESDRSETSAPIRGKVRADVCIVGGGFTGLWAAIHLADQEPSLTVALVEADVCGSGASGRNGGFVMSWWSKFGSLVKACGVEGATRLAQASADAVREIGEFCDRHDIDVAYHHRGWLWAATSNAQLNAWDTTLGKLDRLGLTPFERLGGDEVASRTGSAAHLGGVFEPTAAVVHPGHLVRGLRRVAIDHGVQVYEHSPMRRLSDANGRRQVDTDGGVVEADRVVLALNAWAAPLATYRRFLVVVASDVIATPRIPERIAEIGWESGLPVSDSRRLVNYYRTTDDGRVVFGKGGGTIAFRGRIDGAFNRRSPRELEVTAQFHRAYPALADVFPDQSWRGPIDYSASGLPAFLSVGAHDDTYCGAGYSGNGVGPSYLGGRILASLALGLDDEWTTCGLTTPPRAYLPGEPLRYVGGQLVRRAIARKERLEDRGDRPDWATSNLARLDPTGFVEATQTAT